MSKEVNDTIDDYLKRLERENAAMRADRDAAHERIDALLDELSRAKVRIKELMEIHQ